MSDSDRDRTSDPLIVSGIAPHLASVGDLGPPRSEMAIGALMPWAGRLWAVNYVSHTRASGTGCVLMEVDENLRRVDRPEGRGVDGTYANRIIHYPSSQLMIGPFLIDAERNVRVVDSLVNVRLAGAMEHLTDPDSKLLVLGMEGEFIELDLNTLQTRQLFDLCAELGLPDGARPHFKAAFTAHGRVMVANNSYFAEEFEGTRQAGRLAEWDGSEWRIVDRASYYEIFGRKRLGGVIYASGWDRSSAILMALVPGADGPSWQRYRLPKGSINFEHCWQTEWPRIREIEHERLLMDCHGMFYELSPHAWGGRVFGLRPICSHLWAIPDFCVFRGVLAVGSDQTTPSKGDNVLGGEPESGLWLGKTDDLWSWGRPAGWGGPWWQSPVAGGRPSDPFLMFGFQRACLHLINHGPAAARFRVELDALGIGEFAHHKSFDIPSGGAVQHAFPPGLAAHWLRVVADADTTASAQVMFS